MISSRIEVKEGPFVVQFPGRWRAFVRQQRGNLFGYLQRVERALAPRDPLIAVIRREGIISHGRYIMYFEVTLFGNNPVLLEEYGQVMNRDRDSAPRFRENLEETVAGYKYFIEIRQRFPSIEEAREFWGARGATALWYGG